MSTEKKLVLALYGASCTGKTSSARALSELFNCPLRCAGEAVAARSREMEITPQSLPLEEHRGIDQATLCLVKSARRRVVVEGTFLDALLADSENVLLVELICDDEERRRRFVSREGKDDLSVRDGADRELRHSLHKNHAGTADITIDSTAKSPVEVAKEIIAWIQQRHPDEELV